MVLVCFFLARDIRTKTDLIPHIQLPTQYFSDDVVLLGFALSAAVVMIGVFAIHGLYRIQISHSKIQEVLRLVHLSILSFFVYIGGVYLANGVVYDTQIPRLLLLFAFVLSLCGMLLSRVLLNVLQAFLLKRHLLPRRNIILCLGSESIDRVMQYLGQSTIYHIVGYTASDKFDSLDCPYL